MLTAAHEHRVALGRWGGGRSRRSHVASWRARRARDDRRAHHVRRPGGLGGSWGWRAGEGISPPEQNCAASESFLSKQTRRRFARAGRTERHGVLRSRARTAAPLLRARAVWAAAVLARRLPSYHLGPGPRHNTVSAVPWTCSTITPILV